MGDVPIQGEYHAVLLYTFQVDRGDVPAVETLAFSRDGSMLATGASDGVVRIWDTRSGALIRRMKGTLRYVRKVVFGPFDQYLFACGADGTVKTWEVRTGRLKDKLEAHDDIALSIALNPDADMMASAGRDGKLMIWQRKSGALYKEITFEPGQHINYIEFSPNGKWLVATATNYEERSEDNPNMTDDVYIFNAFSWQDTVRLESNDAERAVFSPDSKRLATTEFRNIMIRDPFTAEVQMTLEGHRSFVNDLIFHPTGELLISGGDDKKVILWDLRNGNHIETVDQHKFMVTSVGINHDGDMIASGDEGGWVYLWKIDLLDPETGRPLKKRRTW